MIEKDVKDFERHITPFVNAIIAKNNPMLIIAQAI